MEKRKKMSKGKKVKVSVTSQDKQERILGHLCFIL